MKKDVVQAGKQLVKAGLIARTWGNVSARISEDHFVITPSGRAYDTLTPAEIVTVSTADGSYRGEIEPSSEKEIHAAIYRQRREINFIIHTHQTFASVLSALHRDMETDDSAAAIIGSTLIPCAAYGLPGSKKLQRGVVAALSRSPGKAFLMAGHGALCLGENRAEAFAVAAELERESEALIMRRYLRLSGGEKADWDELRAYYLSGLSSAGSPAVVSEPAVRRLYSSEREGAQFKLFLNYRPISESSLFEDEQSWLRVDLESPPQESPISSEVEIHRRIYRKFKGIGAIVHAVTPDILTISQTGRPVYPLIDDFAQIIGASARSAAGSSLSQAAGAVVQKLWGRSAVMIRGNGALCCGPSRRDASAAVQILDKGCRAVIGTSLFGGGRVIHPLEARLMRRHYLKEYSRKAAE